MIKLMNSAMMPAEGSFKLRRISTRKFAILLADHYFESSIGYYHTARQIEEIVRRETGTRIQVPVNRQKTTLGSKEFLLICKLKYRLADSRDKRTHQPEIEDLEFFECEYTAPEKLLTEQQIEEQDRGMTSFLLVNSAKPNWMEQRRRRLSQLRDWII